MNDADIVELGFDLLDSAEVVQEFQDKVWISVDKETWEAFCKSWDKA